MSAVASPSKRALSGFGMAALAFVFVVQFVCFCLCGSGISDSTDVHADCHGAALATGGAAAEAAASLTSHGQNCCPEMDSRAAVAVSSREPLPTPQATVSSAASFATLTGPTPASGAASSTVLRTSPPRSPILRI